MTEDHAGASGPHDSVEESRSKESSDHTIEDFKINSWSQPMHIFLGDAEEALCGIGQKAANNQGISGYEPRTFPASNNHNSLSRMVEVFEANPNDDYCQACYQQLLEMGVGE